MRFEFKVVIGFIITLSLVIALGFYTYHNNDNQLKASRWVNHTHKVLYHSEQVLSTLTDIETGQRGFCLTGNLDFLIPYSKGKQNIYPQLNQLKRLTHDNSRQYVRVMKLEMLLEKKLAFSDEVVELYKKDPAQSIALVTSLKGKRLMDNIRLTFSDLMAEENYLLERRTIENEDQIAKSNYLFVLMVSFILIILLILFYTIYINLRARKLAEEKLEAAAKDTQDLYDNAPCGYHSLDANGVFLQVNNTMCEWLGYTKEELIGKMKVFDLMNEEGLKSFRENFPLLKEKGMIQNVQFDIFRKNKTSFPVIVNSTAVRDSNGNYLKSRTTTFDYTEQKLANDKITTLNQELEAFTYTVSHDLRSPLRSISGYAQILEEDYSPVLDDEGKRLTNVIIKSAKRMGQLIDDLLNFSQIGRRDLSNHLIDTNTLVSQLVKELKEEETHPLEINIQDLDPCHGDFNMIRQVWYNLVSNAIKYSKKKELIQIEIGSYTVGPEIVYYVKDNGAGFDMQYVHKLFGVFQRLHRINEFEGTGVGLAIVKRIVTRHGGRVWAEAQPDLGASFYFSIPN
ncbi:MAG: domain S-box protein [Cytophagaceae bacterium]|jgi:PAS domain S-box-containing protein|nr:domain S-box protein [Cytophagaceae bacterium]